MAVKTIETRAKITAEDRTGTTFSQVAQKLRGLESTASQVSRRMDGVASRMSAVGRARMRHEDISRRMGGGLAQTAAAASATMRGIDVAYLSSIAASVIGTAAVFAAAKTLAEKVVTAGSAREGEALNRRIAGITPKEAQDITAAGGIISDQHRSITRTDAEAMLRDARTIVGSTEGALAIGDTLAQLRIVLQRLEPGGDINKQLNDFTRAADLSGATGDPESFKRFANSYAQMQGAFPGVISPLELTEMAKKSHGAALKYSPEFLSGVVPSLIQSSGGASTGEMLASFNRNIVDERLDKQAKKKLAEYGLVDKAGHIRERKLAERDPYLWTRNVLMPGLASHGVKDIGAQSQIAGSLFSDATAAEVTKRFISQSENIERDRQKAREAWDLRQAKEIEKSDMGTALTSVSAQATNAGAALGQQFTPAIIAASKGLAEVFAETGKQLDKKPQFGQELGELSALNGPINPIPLYKSYLDRFWNNTKPQLNMPIGPSLGESVVMQRPPLDFSGVRSIPSGPGKFGFGSNGVGAHWGALAAGLTGGTIEAKAKLEGSASITNKLEIGLSPGLELVRKDSSVRADGALKPNTGISMPPE